MEIDRIEQNVTFADSQLLNAPTKTVFIEYGFDSWNETIHGHALIDARHGVLQTELPRSGFVQSELSLDLHINLFYHLVFVEPVV
jgi:hypothetical protein